VKGNGPKPALITCEREEDQTDFVVEKVLEEKIYEWTNSVLDVAAKDPEVMKTLRETFAAHEELIQPMFRWRYDGQPAGNGWTAPHNLGAFGTDYIHRAGMMYSGPYDNRSTETMYYFTDDDTQLNQLDGNSLYAVIFPKGQLPPVKGFWSLTMYDPRHFFYANDLKRYSLRFASRILCTGR
jgi:hypothetical protein